ncbi:hypothetical protein [Sphingomonas sp.]|uniref:hypothetical protein n=1 Tax=Sphingomonas sp. TaxID=28214 RepID=UPI0025E30ABB|nr:hypothetical protein [Sphingomonas sp.]
MAEVTFLTWTDDGLLRHVVYQGMREDKPAREVTRPLATDAPPPPTTAPPSSHPRASRRKR